MSWLVPATLSAALAAAAALAGCSFDWNATPDGEGGAGGGSVSATTSSTSANGTSTSTSSSGSGGTSVCSPSEPNDNDDCEAPPTYCEYNDDPRPDCRSLFKCEDGHWDVEQSCQCAPPTDALCPPDSGAPAPTCPGSDVLCQFSDGSHCGCAGGLWICPPPPEDGCPTGAPNVGTSCPDPDLECDYGDCSLGTRIRRSCAFGRWRDESFGCTNAPVTCL